MIELPPTPRPQQFGHLTKPINFSYSSNPLTQDIPIPKQNLHAKTPYDPTRKRPLEGHVASEYYHRTKRTYFIDKTPGTLILEARDLLVKAAGLTKEYDKQTRLLDLIEIFREYAEKEKVLKTSNIIASQVASLENTTRRMESKAKELVQTAPKNRTIAQIASIDPKSTPIGPKPEEWTLVEKKKQHQTSKTTKITSNVYKHLILVQPKDQNLDFSPLTIRNKLNLVFASKGIKDPVIASITKTLGGNLVITTTPTFSAAFLIEKKTI
jgi:hypothetical protein